MATELTPAADLARHAADAVRALPGAPESHDIGSIGDVLGHLSDLALSVPKAIEDLPTYIVDLASDGELVAGPNGATVKTIRNELRAAIQDAAAASWLLSSALTRARDVMSNVTVRT
ncbi:hypothetical protein ABZ135_23255 [Streptomyces sp. NPDC006339]|uniref:hypothetical protein n=1 Tax=Streptomyces sp. NPDC006339 TaxID=3156755 RepID=UPI0033B8F996